MDHSLICGKTPFLVPDIGLGVRSASGENVGENWMRRSREKTQIRPVSASSRRCAP
jgi:hypothetical protein